MHVSTAASWRGGEQQVAYLVRALGELGTEQVVFCVRNAPLALHCFANGIKTIEFKKTGSLNLKAANMLATFCSTHSHTIVHCHDSHAHTLAFLAAWFFQNHSPIIVHRRVDFPVSRNVFSRMKYNHSRIKKLICVSDAIRQMLVPALKSPEKAVVIHSGIDTGRFRNVERRNNLKKEFGFSDKHILIGNIAALAPHKDYNTFLRTAEILARNNSGYRFVIVGEGSERKNIENEINSRNLTDKVVLAGFRKNIPELIKELDVLLLTSKTEGLGTSILDAFAGGLPVVATRTGGIPEIVEHMVNGLLAEVGNAQELADMTTLVINDRLLRESIIKKAAAIALGFDYRITASKTLELYQQISPTYKLTTE